MAQADIGRLNIRISASSQELDRELDRTGKRLRDFKKQTETKGGFGNVLEGILGRFGISAGGGAMAAAAAGIAVATTAIKKFADTVHEASKAADDLHDKASALGATVPGLFALREGAFGVQEELDKGLDKLARDIGTAIRGNEEAQKSFERLGLSWRQLAAIPLDEAFHKVRAAINKLPSDMQKNDEAFERFGRRGQKMLELLARPRSFFEDIKRHGIQTGAVPSKELAESHETLEKASQKINAEWTGIKNSVAETAHSMPLLTFAATSAMAKFLEINRKMFRLATGQEVNPAAGQPIRNLEQMQKQAQDVRRAVQDVRKEQAKPAPALTDAQKKDEDAVKHLLDAIKTPLERANEEMLQLIDLSIRGKITMDEFARGTARLADELIRAADIQEKAALPAPDALLKGSQAARSFLTDIERRELSPEKGDKAEKLAAALKKLQEIATEQKNDVKRIMDFMRDKLKVLGVRF